MKREKLAARRVALGLTQEMLAEATGVTAAAVRRWELGAARPRARQRAPLAEKLQVTLPELERMLGGGGSVEAPNGHAVPSTLDHFASLEQGASRLQSFEPITVPGLLQTADYARAAMETNWRSPSSEAISGWVEGRLARQEVLDREPSPLELCCVVDESVLNRVTGGPGVMAAQLDHMVSMAQRPTVQLQIFPAESPSLHSAAFGSFTLFTSDSSSRPFMVCTEDLTGFNYLDRPPALEIHAELFEHLATVALSPEQSAELIQNRAERYRYQ